MTIIKLSKSGKQIQVIDDFGNVYGAATQMNQALLNGTVKGGFIMLQRLPFKVSPDRFGQSPVWNPEGAAVMPLSGSVEIANDAFAPKNIKKKEDTVIVNNFDNIVL